MASQNSRSPFKAMGPNSYTEMWLNVTSVSTKQPHGGKQHHFSSSTVNKNSNSTTNSARQPFTYPPFAETLPIKGTNAQCAKGITQNQNAEITPKHNTSNNTEKPEKTTKNQTSNNK